VDLCDYVPPTPNYPPINDPPPGTPSPITPLTYQAFLPDAPTLLGRFLLSGWDHGLENADDDAAQLLAVALKVEHLYLFSL
jgi:hypothetical protein